MAERIIGDVMGGIQCRACRNPRGDLVLDLGEQPAADYFPRVDDPGPDPVYPLQMWLCASCGLAQLAYDSTIPEEPKALEPAALVSQALDAVERLTTSGWLVPGQRVAEYGSPHGGSWLGKLSAYGLVPRSGRERVDVVIDSFGLMHAPDQSSALAERVCRLDTDGVLLLQYHSLEAIIRLGQWNSLRHGHYAYYSATALDRMLRGVGFRPRMAWRFELYGGTVLLAAQRGARGEPSGDVSPQALFDEEARRGVTDPEVLRGLQEHAHAQGEGLRRWLASERDAGRLVLGYGAASRAVALLVRAGVNSTLLPAVADASTSKQGLRMPGTDIPVVSPSELVVRNPRKVLLFLPDLLPEVRAAIPAVEGSGAQWVDIDRVTPEPLDQGIHHGRVSSGRS